ncbi:MAG: MFS transporter [Alphaproteobacteria bacterium]|nr:MFS transporter [Alphaproteobacteria bacterium]
MTRTQSPQGVAGRPTVSAFRSCILPLAVAQTIVWAAVYYSFAGLLPRWEADFGWSKAEITGAFTLALVLSGLAAPKTGALIDRGHGRVLLVSGSVIAAALLVALSQVTSLFAFYAVWAALGLTMAAILYEPCFALLTVRYGDGARRAITQVTLVAGFAGTVSFPIAHLAGEAFGWRGALLVFAGLALAGAMLNAWGLRRGPEHEIPPRGTNAPPHKPLSERAKANRQAILFLLGIGFLGISLNHGSLVAHMLPLMESRMIDAGTAILFASALGPMQVVGRLLLISVEHRLSSAVLGMIPFVGYILGSVLVLMGAGLPALIVAFVFFQGAAAGITSIMKPAVTAAFLGREGFGAVSGSLALFFMLGSALAPTLASFLWGVGGYDLVVLMTLSVAVGGFAAYLLARRKANA